MAHIRETGPADETDITGADHGDFHSDDFTV
jgi:hypothetical protein